MVKRINNMIRKNLDPIMAKFTKSAHDEMSIEFAAIIESNALAAGAAGLCSALPGIGPTLSAFANLPFLCNTIYKINKILNVELSKARRKSIAKLLLTTIAAATTVSTLTSTVLSLFPLVGQAGATLVMAACNFASITVAGLVYVRTIMEVIHNGQDPSMMSEDSLKEKLKSSIDNSEIDEMMKQASEIYKKAYKSGDVTGKETVEMESE